MTQEHKELLLKDLCARLPYGVKIQYDIYGIQDLTIDKLNAYIKGIKNIKPYLRPMSSMTEEEKKEYQSQCEIHFDNDADANFIAYYFDTVESFEWLNKNMFDYRELIPKDLALSTEVFNPYKSI